jgi:methanobactin biosynthesis cassette protein MbnB
MRIGFNFTLSDTHDMVQRLIAEGQIDYCELLIDNFLCVPPTELAKTFDCPVGFHIMFSEFIESDRDALNELASRLRIYIDALNPMYVSDHAACFMHRGRHLFHPGEINYRTEYDHVREKVELWQELLGRRICFENYPSIMDGGLDAPDFFERLMKDTGAGVLFDASNAICAKHNCGAPLEAWEKVIASNQNFHVAGYRPSLTEPYIMLDTHGDALAQDTLEFLKSQRAIFDRPGNTLTYERDFNIDYDAIVADLTELREIFPKTQEASHDAFAAA